MKWIQYTTVAGEKRDPIYRTDEEMIGILAQVTFLRQAGEENELHVKATDSDYHVKSYSLTRNMKDYTVEYLFVKIH